MNAFLSVLRENEIKPDILKRGKLSTLQVNMGNLCNQSCQHCHIEASPLGRNVMPKKVVDDVLSFLKRYKIKTLDITGGAPELNPEFDYLASSARRLVDEVIVRSNLTVLFEEGKDHLPDFFKSNRLHLICSLPCYTKENVDRQRGGGVFEKSIRALRLLNQAGFSRKEGLRLDLVYNPLSGYLPGQAGILEKDYKKALKENYGIEFDRIITITNVAIKKFKKYLESNGEYEKYSNILKDNFNPETIPELMCRTFLSVGFDGRIYDCDFNLALGYALKDSNGEYLDIGNFNPHTLEDRLVITAEHCLACTAGSGSSCQGALVEDKKETVKQYYGKILKGSDDLKTSACCSMDSFPDSVKVVLKDIESEILDKFYGCGSPIPPLLKGCNVLDLGCGTGRDVYLASYLVGQDGFVIGIDMTDEQLEVALRHKNTQIKRFGFKRCNIDFRKSYIEDLKEAFIKDNSQDVVISNCVINLSPDKKAVFEEIFRALKPGGELYFSDIFSGRRIAENIKNDPVLYAECLGGALYIEDFRRMLRELGCPDYRIVSRRKISINESAIREKVDGIDFYSMTIRVFKLDDLEDICEDYGQAALYLGTIPDNPHQFKLDEHHIFIKNKATLICGNTASMLLNTRYGNHFKVIGDRSIHYGPFKCGSHSVRLKDEEPDSAGSCC